MHYRRFVAPIEQLRHYAAVCALRAKHIHRRAVFPGRQRPKDSSCLHKQPAAEKARGVLGLARNLRGFPKERSEVPRGAHPQSSYRNKCHPSLQRSNDSMTRTLKRKRVHFGESLGASARIAGASSRKYSNLAWLSLWPVQRLI